MYLEVRRTWCVGQITRNVGMSSVSYGLTKLALKKYNLSLRVSFSLLSAVLDRPQSIFIAARFDDAPSQTVARFLRPNCDRDYMVTNLQSI